MKPAPKKTRCLGMMYRKVCFALNWLFNKEILTDSLLAQKWGNLLHAEFSTKERREKTSFRLPLEENVVLLSIMHQHNLELYFSQKENINERESVSMQLSSFKPHLLLPYFHEDGSHAVPIVRYKPRHHPTPDRFWEMDQGRQALGSNTYLQ